MNQPFNSEVPQNYQSREVSQESGLVKAIKTIVKIILIIGGIILLIPVALIAFCLIVLFGFGTGGIGFIVAIVVIVLIVRSSRKKKAPNKPNPAQQNYMLLAFLGITFIFLFAMGQSNVDSFSCPVHYDFYYMALLLLQMSWIAIAGVNFFSMIFSREEKVNYRK